MNGDVVAQGSQFSLKDVEVVVAQIDLDAVCCYINNLCISSYTLLAGGRKVLPH